MWFCIWCCVCATVREERERIYSHQHSVRLRTRTWRATKTLYKMYYILYWALTRNQQRFICTIVCSYFEFLWIRHLPYNGPGISPGWKVHFDCCRCCATSPRPTEYSTTNNFFFGGIQQSKLYPLYAKTTHQVWLRNNFFRDQCREKSTLHSYTDIKFFGCCCLGRCCCCRHSPLIDAARVVDFIPCQWKQQKKKHCWKDPKCKFNNPYYSIWYIIKQMLGREGKMIVKAQMFVTLL